jgi:tRNA (guanine-N7-)-methyltransferase
MAKKKLQHFQENENFPHVFQPNNEQMKSGEHSIKGNWNKNYFKNNNPLILELGCGKGEYTVGMSKFFPENNYVGVDVKGARIWRGAKTVEEENINNAAFLRTKVEFLDSFFAPEEVDEIWLTFSDPQVDDKKGTKRLTSNNFIDIYRKVAKKNAVIHLKTDSYFLHQCAQETITKNKLKIIYTTTDLYGDEIESLSVAEKKILHIRTFYENKFLAKGVKINYCKFTLW